MADTDFILPLVTGDELRVKFNYNAETGIFTRKNGKVVGSWDVHGYKTVRIGRRSYKLHRLAWLYVNNIWPHGDIDHINGVRYDNCISNLRDVSRQVNLQNQRKPTSINKSTGVLGVYPTRVGTFYAAISINNKKKHLGTFETMQEASEAYLVAKRLLHTGCVL